MNKTKNPLKKRLFRELKDDWKKNFIVFAFLTLTISFVSGMFVANESILISARKGTEIYRREDGHFELEKPANPSFIEAVQTGEKAKLKDYFLEKGKEELDEKFTKEFDKEFTSRFQEEFQQGFENRYQEELKKNLVCQGLTEDRISEMLPNLFLTARETEEYKELYQQSYDESFQKEYDKSYQKAYDDAYNEMNEKVEQEYEKAIDKIEENSSDFVIVRTDLYENFYKNEQEDSDNDGVFDGRIRVYKLTDEINLPCVINGRLPEAKNEIAMDRMHSKHINLTVGDSIQVSGKEFQIVGLVSFPNYYTLHEKTSDFAYDSINFNVGAMTEDGFASLNGDTHYSYAWKYHKKPETKSEENQCSDWFLQSLYTHSIVMENEIKDYVPAFRNPAICFAIDDMGSDEVMGGILLNILTVIIAFIFAVTISNKITQEASAIGTLRASGYRRFEILLHYLFVPVIITLFSALLGNILSYTVFKHFVASMYYNSYSLPTYQTYWNYEAFIRTTLIPVVIMFLVNFAVLYRKLCYSPLEFLRHELKRSKRNKTVRLPGWSFFSRFRLRIILQSIPNYIVLFIGMVFIAVMLSMAVGMNESLDYYQKNAQNMMLSDYQYVLKSHKNQDGEIIKIRNSNAERYSLKMMERQSEKKIEDVSVFGIISNSQYINIEKPEQLKDNEVYISKPFSEKYNIKIGEQIELVEKFKTKKYVFKVVGIHKKGTEISVFLPASNFHHMFETDMESFNGYFSNSELSELKEEDIAMIITPNDILSMSEQLDYSLGAYMKYFSYLCILLSAGMIYLITKILIEKNQVHISMIKILGYKNREIVRLYLLATSAVFIIMNFLAVFIGAGYMRYQWRKIMIRFNGWFSFRIGIAGHLMIFSFILLGYFIVLFFDFQRIRKIPMGEALKTLE